MAWLCCLALTLPNEGLRTGTIFPGRRRVNNKHWIMKTQALIPALLIVPLGQVTHLPEPKFSHGSVREKEEMMQMNAA